mmetsp:Transcript_64550/g.129810  ORF Transcript_64550/g.129810 Transcript_64550/m.129810 type:complete len:267 (-) Transcript_64550:472-1272(-)
MVGRSLFVRPRPVQLQALRRNHGGLHHCRPEDGGLPRPKRLPAFVRPNRRGGRRVLRLQPLRRMHLRGRPPPPPPKPQEPHFFFCDDDDAVAIFERGGGCFERLRVRRRRRARGVGHQRSSHGSAARGPKCQLLQRRQRSRDGLHGVGAQFDAFLPRRCGEPPRDSRAGVQRRHGPGHQLVSRSELDRGARARGNGWVGALDAGWVPAHGRLRDALQGRLGLSDDPGFGPHGSPVQARGRALVHVPLDRQRNALAFVQRHLHHPSS